MTDTLTHAIIVAAAFAVGLIGTVALFGTEGIVTTAVVGGVSIGIGLTINAVTRKQT